VAFYKVNVDADSDEDNGILFTPIDSGYAIPAISTFKLEFPAQVLVYTEIQNDLLKIRQVRAFIPYPKGYKISPRLVQFSNQLVIRAVNSNFRSQPFALIPYALKTS